jgi:hypothetical protein
MNRRELVKLAVGVVAAWAALVVGGLAAAVGFWFGWGLGQLLLMWAERRTSGPA